MVQSVFQKEEFPQYILKPFDRIILVIDSNVDDIYGDEIRKLLAGPKRKLETVVLQVSEKQKDMFSVMDMVSTFERVGLAQAERSDRCGRRGSAFGCRKLRLQHVEARCSHS